MIPVKMKCRLILSFVIFLCCWQKLHAQAPWIGYSGELKWLRINSLHAYISELGSEMEASGDNGRNIRFSWPGAYGLDQATMRANGIWLGCTDYYDSKVDKQFPYMVTNSGLKPGEYDPRPWADAIEFKLIGRFDHPQVYVDNQPATINVLYDDLDEIDETMLADRMVLCTNHTSIGVTVSKKIYVFTQQNHDNYYIYHYKLTNTGIIDNDSTMNPQTINDFYFQCLYRYALGGEAITETGATTGRNWASAYAAWGRNTVNDVIGTDPATSDFEMRAVFAWYGPDSERPVPLEDDWGCPNEKDDGVMAAAKYVGHVTLHADQSAYDRSDDPYQPRTTHYIGSDANEAQRAFSQYDEYFMTQRYNFMGIGHAPMTHAELIEASGLAANDWAAANGDAANGVTSIQGFGPYTLEPGSSIDIIIAGCIAGLSREKNREVGGNWLEYYNGTGTPELIMPNRSETTNHTEYKKAWVLTAKDSLIQTFGRAIGNYESGYDIPKPPPPPEEFIINSGGDRIVLAWSKNATTWPNFDGYVIYRAKNSVMSPVTVYEKIFECDASHPVHMYHDTWVVRGFDYYYYIQTKDDGSTNDIHPGEPLYSSKFWTLTSRPARLVEFANVYPGDTDCNTIVDELDILSIGVHFLEEGNPRDTVTFSWGPHQAILWDEVAATFADANGDGIVDEKDVIGIGVNWGNTHTSSTVDYCIDPGNRMLINTHREAFETMYYSLSGESEAVRSMKRLLESILDLNVPQQFSLSQNYPNPFNPKTKIQFALPEDQNVTLTVYNLLGQQVKVLIDHQSYEAGVQTVSLNGEDLGSGVYVYRIVTEKWNATRKMLIVK